jgi:hypothetical protein
MTFLGILGVFGNVGIIPERHLIYTPVCHHFHSPGSVIRSHQRMFFADRQDCTQQIPLHGLPCEVLPPQSTHKGHRKTVAAPAMKSIAQRVMMIFLWKRKRRDKAAAMIARAMALSPATMNAHGVCMGRG